MDCKRVVLAGACAASLVACAGGAGDVKPTSPAAVAPVPEYMPGVPAGYLGKALPDSLVLVPPPPAAGSPAFAQDEAMHAAVQAVRNGPRGALATADANLDFPQAAAQFECALGRSISKETTPRLYLLMQRTMVDAGIATSRAKEHYQRARPFVHYKESMCTPDEGADLRADGSYPSGHTAIGWAWGLVLAEIAPERGDALVRRGRAFGESRMVCNVHWQSDILAGRAVAAAAVARLHANPTFTADLAAARAELANAAVPDAARCASEASLLEPLPGSL